METITSDTSDGWTEDNLCDVGVILADLFVSVIFYKTKMESLALSSSGFIIKSPAMIFHSFRNEPLSAWGRYHNIDVAQMSVSVWGLSLSQSPTPRQGSFTVTVCECESENVFLFLPFLWE